MTARTITAPDADAEELARDRLDGLAKPRGSLGRLEDLAAWWSACQGHCPPHALERVRAVVPAGDHGVVAAGVSPYPAEITGAMVRTIAAGFAGVSVLARQHGVPVRVLDISVAADLSDLDDDVTSHKLASGCGAINVEDAMTLDQTDEAMTTGARIVSEEIDAGAQLLIVGDLGIGNTTPAAALIAASLDRDAADVTGRGAGLDDEGLVRKTAVVQAALDRARCEATIADPIERLAALGSPDLAVAVGMLVEAARRRLPVLLDGVINVAEALIAEDIAPGARNWWQAGHRSTEPAQTLALEHLGLTPLIDLQLRLGEGSGAMAALPLLRSAVAVINEMALLADLLPSE